MKWGEYKLGDIFVKLSTRYKWKWNKFKNISNTKNDEYCIPLTYAKSWDNWIMYWGRKWDFETHENVISIVYNWAIAAGLVYAQENETWVLAESYLIKLKKYNASFNINLYLKSTLEKILYAKYSREYLATWANKVENDIIKLPTRDWQIDFEFINDFVAELEAYLTATWLRDYYLTDQEKQVLSDFEAGKFEWSKFRISDLLEWQPQKEIDPLKLEQLKDETENLYPFYGQSTTNNGIISYNQLNNNVLNNKKWKPTILIHSNNQNIVYLETPFYLKDWHWATSVLQTENLNKINQMFIIWSIDKVIKNKYSYNSKATKIELKNSIIELPTYNSQPDYELMEIFISAIQKLVIRDVVIYADRKITATKHIINNK